MGYFTVRTPNGSDDPIDLGNALFQAINNLPAYHTMEVPRGNYNLGTNQIKVPRGAKIIGPDGPVDTVIHTQFAKQTGIWCCFEYAGDSSLIGLTLQSDCALTDESILAGWSKGRDAQLGHSKAEIRDCILIGGRWCHYDWTSKGNRTTYYNCQLSGHRWIVSNDGSSGIDAGFVDLYKCKITGVSTGTTYPTGQNQELVGLVNRGGIAKLFDTTITLTGDPLSDLVAAVWAGYNPSPNQQLELYNLTSRVNSGGSPRALDVVNDSDGFTIALHGGSGSGTGGAFTTYGKVA